ncbi:MAG: hypothetical protein EOP10_04595, partial [Proteobacteria bacterium]
LDVSEDHKNDARWITRGQRNPKSEGLFHDRAYRVSDWQESELGDLDPLFHLGFGAARDALTQCKTEGLARNRMGLILGNIALPTESSSQLASEWLARQWGLSDISGQSPEAMKANLNPAAMPALILSRMLDIQGSTFTLDAACASSLYAIKLACDELVEGRLDFVLAGGLSRPDPLYTQVGFTALDALSKAGKAFPLDGRADGLMVGEGAGIFGLKRLEDAERQGDTILAVIRGVGLSNDKEGGLMAPSQEGQWRAMQAAYVDAEWDPKSVELIECHATGTALGDSTEIQSLIRIRSGKADCVLGSVKSNVGHMLTAAGAAGIAKLLCSFREKKFWPTANFSEAPGNWGLSENGLRILKTAETWTSRNELRRAGISGFGFGGINAHVLLEEYVRDISETVVRIKPKRKVCVIKASRIQLPREATGLEIGFKQFRIPPKEMKEILPQQILSLLTLDSVLPLEGLDKDKTGCFVGVELDAMTSLFATRWQLQDRLPDINFDAYVPALQANQVMGSLASIAASRCARELQIGGPSFTISAMESSGIKALELAQRAIARGELSAAIVMATDIGSSHRARSQTQDVFDHQWAENSDHSVAVVLMEESKTRELGLDAAVTLDEFYEYSHTLDRPVTEGPLWIEDIQRDSAWLSQINHPRKKLVESRDYAGPAHGLLSLVNIWEVGGERAALLIRDEKMHQVSWHQKAKLSVTHELATVEESYTVQRRDKTLAPVETFMPVAAVTPIETRKPVVAAQAQSAKSPMTSVWASSLLRQELSTIHAHEEFLKFQGEGNDLIAQLLFNSNTRPVQSVQTPDELPSQEKSWVGAPFNQTPAIYDYEACKEFAVGKISRVFGADFQEIDGFPTRVRLPAERLLLCHRVMSISGTPRTLGSGRMVTEHDVFANAWYLEDGDDYMPTSIAVESGQADLMLSAYLGADFATRGHAVYRLLDARVAFHSKPPKVGETIRYEIEIKKFFEQGGTLFFNFAFEGYVGDRHVMSMVDGCAGFFTENALDEGRGIKRSQLQLKAYPGKITGDFKPLVPMVEQAFTDADIEALQLGDYARAFGQDFQNKVQSPKKLPSGDMKLVHRIRELDPRGGRFGIGSITGEADIHPDDWFLTCHFIDDQVMPGTLMFECCLHTLRVFLMRAGWIGEADTQSLVPKPGVWSGLKCRGQVLPTTKKVTYEIEIKEIGYGPDAYVICDALMYADGKPIVDITDMSLTLLGHTKQTFETLWGQAARPEPAFTYEDILAFSNGNPSDCFGDVYKVFDSQRKIARLPRPPFQFLDSVEWVEGPYMVQNVGTRLVAHYENPDDAWYWSLNHNRLPFSVLVEIALQPCGFMAAYMGSALCSERDLKFRNLSGEGTLLQDIQRGDGRLSIEVISTKIAKSGDMIIQDYSFRVFAQRGDVYQGTTSFGFFTEEALAQQAGLRGEKSWDERAVTKPYPQSKALPQGRLRMVDTWDYESGKIYGAKTVNPEEWFFEAHFFEDPVMPGSLGLESLTQIACAEADRRLPNKNWRVALNSTHNWVYRGQVRKPNKEVRLKLDISEQTDDQMTFDSVLYCDGLAIYKLDKLTIEVV